MEKLKNNEKNAIEEETFKKIICDFKVPIIYQIDALKNFLSTSSSKINKEEKELIELTLYSCKIIKNSSDIFLMAYKNEFKNNNLEYEKFDFVLLLKEIIQDYSILFQYHNLELELNIPENLYLYADKTKIKKILENLILNNINIAFKNTKIIIEITDKITQMEFKIKTKSKTIEQNIIKEIFLKNKKINSQFQKPSMGLGMYVLYEVIKIHFGKAFVKSYSNNTNVFGFSLPIKN